MRWKNVFFVILVTLCVQTIFIKAQGLFDPFGLRRRNKERGRNSQEEGRYEDDENPEPRRILPPLDWLNPFEFGLSHDRQRSQETSRNRDYRRKHETSHEIHDNANTRDREVPVPMPRSLDLSSSRTENEKDKDQNTGQKLEYGPCGPNNQYCDGENYIKELGLTWSRRVHNGTGIYLRDPNAPGGKRFVLVGIDLPNEKFGYCVTPKNEPGYCRHLEHCVLDEFRSNFITFLAYLCDIPNQNYVGACCPRSKEDSNISRPRSGNAPTTIPPRPDGRDLAPPFPPFDLPPFDLPPFRRRTTTAPPVPPRRRTNNRSRGEASSSRPQPRHNVNVACGVNEIKMPRIVGGRRSDPKAWPWMAALLKTKEATNYRAGQYCGGVLISEFHVLTAAHCVDGLDKTALAVRIGEYDFSRRNETSSPLDIQITDVFTHEKFNRYTYQNDIAILKLAKSAYQEKRIQSICLPKPHLEEKSFVNEVGIVTGFGTLWYGGPSSDTLQEINVPIWRQEDCQAAYAQPIEETNLCAGVRAGSRDSCQGDSGGPLQMQLRGRWTVIGIVSWGIRCSEPGYVPQENYPGVYTRVTKYIDWITHNMH